MKLGWYARQMKSQQDKASYAARVIRTFLDETCGPYNLDGLLHAPFATLSWIAWLRASSLDLPVDADGQRELLALADEADRLAIGNGS